MTERDTDAAVAALAALTRHGIPPDIQELLIYGSPRIGVKPGALSKAMAAAITAYQAKGENDD
jgi:hypothetical protein